MQSFDQSTIAVIGLGYVGLPLAVAFGNQISTIGYDKNSARIDDLKNGIDGTLEISSEELAAAKQISFSDTDECLQKANIFIVTVPTPITTSNQPDLSPLLSASEDIGNHLKIGDVVIYESTVFPGATEEICVPTLEKHSGLKLNVDFHVGYSPERINPGDKEHRLEDILKITSGSTTAAAEYIDDLYNLVIKAGTYKAESIRVAEAAKVIENTQRDINIALVNEIALICDRLDIDTLQVLAAAGTKWNFLPFKPGLVGGHCIGVDPYYLTHKAEEVGYRPEVILSGRRTNDNIAEFIAQKVVKLIIRKGHSPAHARTLIMGLTFKENCPDIRNTKVVDIISALEDYGIDVDVSDPWANATEAKREYGVQLIEEPANNHYEAIIVAVPHNQFKETGVDAIKQYGKANAVLFDIRGLFGINDVDGRL